MIVLILGAGVLVANTALADNYQKYCTLPLQQNSFSVVRLDMPFFSDDYGVYLDSHGAPGDGYQHSGVFIVDPTDHRVLEYSVSVRAGGEERIYSENVDMTPPHHPSVPYGTTGSGGGSRYRQSVYAIAFSMGAPPTPGSHATVQSLYTCVPMSVDGDLVHFNQFDFHGPSGQRGQTYLDGAGTGSGLSMTFDVHRNLFFGFDFTRVLAGSSSLSVEPPGGTSFIDQQSNVPNELSSASGRWASRLSYQGILPAVEIAGIELDIPDVFAPGPIVASPSGTTTRVHDIPTRELALSADGRYVVFTLDVGQPPHLTPGDNFGLNDLYVLDRQNGTYTRASIQTDGDSETRMSYGPAISADGRYVAFTTNWTDNYVTHFRVYRFDSVTGTLALVSVNSAGEEANGSTVLDGMSADGRYVVLDSLATNLAPGDTNDHPDIFVRDIANGTTKRVSLDANGAEWPDGGWGSAISGNGRYVAYIHPLGLDGTEILRYDLVTGAVTRVAQGSGPDAAGLVNEAHMSYDGRFVIYRSGFERNTNQIYVWDGATAATALVSARPDGQQGNLDADWPNISSDGRWATFESYSDDLVGDDHNGAGDVFRRDLQHGVTSRVSVDSQNHESSGTSLYSAMSSDGSVIGFFSWANNLSSNGMRGVFIRQLQP